MIISFDGNVFAGKSTLIQNLAKKTNYNRIGEHSEFHKKTSTKGELSEDPKKRQEKYFSVEHLRKQTANSRNLLVDRSFVSMSAHVYAQAVSFGVDISDWYVEKLRRELNNGNILVPDQFVFVRVDYEEAVKRFNRDQKKNTPEFLINEQYFTAVEEYNIIWIEKFEGLILDTSTNHLDKVAGSDLSQQRFSHKELVSTTQYIFDKISKKS